MFTRGLTQLASRSDARMASFWVGSIFPMVVPMRFLGVDHVLLAMPPGEEEKARDFYGRILGLSEAVKPPVLAARGGAWFEQGDLKIHLGVEKNFAPARKAHPAFLVEGLAALAARLAAESYPVTTDEPTPGYDRVFTQDPFGNRIELVERRGNDGV